MHDFAIWDFNSKAFVLSTKTERSDLTEREVKLDISKQLGNLPYFINTRKVGNNYYYFLQCYDKSVEKVLVFKIGVVGVHRQMSDDDLDNLNQNAYFDEKHNLFTKFVREPDYIEPDIKEDEKVEQTSLF